MVIQFNSIGVSSFPRGIPSLVTTYQLFFSFSKSIFPTKQCLIPKVFELTNQRKISFCFSLNHAHYQLINIFLVFFSVFFVCISIEHHRIECVRCDRNKYRFCSQSDSLKKDGDLHQDGPRKIGKSNLIFFLIVFWNFLVHCLNYLLSTFFYLYSRLFYGPINLTISQEREIFCLLKVKPEENLQYFLETISFKEEFQF